MYGLLDNCTLLPLFFLIYVRRGDNVCHLRQYFLNLIIFTHLFSNLYPSVDNDCSHQASSEGPQKFSLPKSTKMVGQNRGIF